MTQARRPAPAARRPARRPGLDGAKGADPRRRLVAVGILVAMVMSLFAGRLLQLQGVEAAAYAATAEAERLRTVTIPATRGAITDANGIALATTVDAVNVTADQTQIADPVAVAAALAPVLGEPIKTLANRLDGDLRFAYVAKEVTPEAVGRGCRAAAARHLQRADRQAGVPAGLARCRRARVRRQRRARARRAWSTAGTRSWPARTAK